MRSKLLQRCYYVDGATEAILKQNLGHLGSVYRAKCCLPRSTRHMIFLTALVLLCDLKTVYVSHFLVLAMDLEVFGKTKKFQTRALKLTI